MSATAIRVQAPAHRGPELAWVCAVVFERWLGLTVRIEPCAGPDVIIELAQGRVVWTDVFLQQADSQWLERTSLPIAPMAMWALPEAELVRRIGEPRVAQCFGDGRFHCVPGEVRLPVDITGSAFFMLSRYEEEVAGATRDRFGRVPGVAGVAHRSGLALRPLVDEWVELLWWALQQVAPGLQRRPRCASTWISCDVDAPYSPGTKSAALLLRQTASHLLKDHSLRLAGQAVLNAAATRMGITRFDAFDTFDWMLERNEQAGHRMSFFFLSVHKPEIINGCYELAEPRIAALLAKALNRGHEVGLHGSYHSVDNADMLHGELAELRAAVHRAGGTQPVVGARQHYLRWQGSRTARQLDGLRLQYDSTLGFPDIAGFRCGTCHRYGLFDLLQRQPLQLEERPLVLMEATVMSSVYMGLGHGEQAWDLMMGLRERCRRFEGEFSLLWHNSHLRTPGARALYEALLKA